VGEPRRIVLRCREKRWPRASDETIDAATVEAHGKEMSRAMEGGDLELAVVVGGGQHLAGTTARAAAWTVPPPTPWACWGQ